MKERPILFTPENAQKVHLGTKTQTRRVIKLPRWAEPSEEYEFEIDDAEVNGVKVDWPYAIAKRSGCLAAIECPYGQPGDWLWVRESFHAESKQAIHYRGDFGSYENSHRNGWKTAMFMPRWACRTVLELTAVRVERLQEISEKDARAEGCQVPEIIYPDTPRESYSYVEQYKLLWESIHGKGSWAMNSWVWVLEFRKV